MKTYLRTILLIAVTFALALAADQIAPLKLLTLYLNRHPDPYKTITTSFSVVGWTLLVAVFIFLLWTRGHPVPEDEARQFMESPPNQPGLSSVLRGPAVGREFNIVVSYAEIKDAIRTGEWIHSSRWWPIFLALLAVPLIMYGMFGFFFVIGSPFVKLLCGGTLAYATVRTIWGFWQA